MTDYERRKNTRDTERSRSEDRYSPYRDEELRRMIENLRSAGTGRTLTREEYDRLKMEIKPEIIRKFKSLEKGKKTSFTELRLIADEVIGNLFNRVEFLKTRINELESALIERQEIDQSQIVEITSDVEEKKKKLLSLSNIDDIREFELDITNLKMEKRKETLTYWRDKLEVRRELQELKEEYQNKAKIIEIFTKSKATSE